MRNAPLAAPSGGSAAQRQRGCRWMVESCIYYHSTEDTPSVSPYGLPAPPSGSRGIVRIRLRLHKGAGACRETPQSGPLGLPAPLSGALFSLPPLGEVPRSGKGGDARNSELSPFNEPHPLSQAVRPASSPIGEPRKPPLKGLAGVAVLDGVQLLNAGLRTAQRLRGAVSGYVFAKT